MFLTPDTWFAQVDDLRQKMGAFTGWGTPSIRTIRRTVSWSRQASDGAGGWFHVMAMGEQITNIAKTGIIGNLRDSMLIYPHCFRFFFMRPSKTGKNTHLYPAPDCISSLRSEWVTERERRLRYFADTTLLFVLLWEYDIILLKDYEFPDDMFSPNWLLPQMVMCPCHGQKV